MNPSWGEAAALVYGLTAFIVWAHLMLAAGREVDKEKAAEGMARHLQALRWFLLFLVYTAAAIAWLPMALARWARGPA
jgi:hypothetical protein